MPRTTAKPPPACPFI